MSNFDKDWENMFGVFFLVFNLYIPIKVTFSFLYSEVPMSELETTVENHIFLSASCRESVLGSMAMCFHEPDALWHAKCAQMV